MKRFIFPAMDEHTLENGLKIIKIPDHEQEGLVIALQFPFGRFVDPEGLEGCSEISIGLMQKGTLTHNSEQFSEEFEHHGASLFAEIGEEHVMIGVKMLSRFKDRLFPLFWEMVVAPRLDNKEFVRLQQEMTTSLHAETVDPGAIANRHFYHELADGGAHPAGRHHTIHSIKKIGLSNIVDFYRANVQPHSAILVIAGNFTGEWFVQRCLSSVATWNTTAPIVRSDAPPLTNKASVIRFVEKNDLTQVSLVIGQSAPGELDSDRNKIALANYVFGAGNFSSRLMNRIRSSTGKTYSIMSHITAERNCGALTISTSTQNRQLHEVVTAILEEYTRFCKSGITADELDTVKKFAIGNMAFQLEGLTNFVEKILWLSFYNRTIDYIESFDTMIDAITLDSVNEAVARCFDPGKMIIVGVGKRSEVLTQLSSFGKVKNYHYKDRL
jgi:zinc protease